MRPILSISLIVIFALASNAWWGRRRRRGWVGKTIKKVGSFYGKHKNIINPIATSLIAGWGKDVRGQLLSLKNNDRESYNNFMMLLRADLETRFPEQDVHEIIENLDEIAEMQPDELLLLDGENETDDQDLAGSEILKDLSERVDALNSH